jgi:hypothetical protein
MSTVVNACGTINTSYGMKMGMTMGVRVERNCMEKRDLYTVNYISNPSPLYQNQRRDDVDVDKVGDGMESRGDELINYTKIAGKKVRRYTHHCPLALLPLTLPLPGQAPLTSAST